MATAAQSAERIGDLLVREGLITREQLQQALREQKSTGMRLGYVLVQLGFVQELEITKMLARQYRVPAIDLSRFEVDDKIIKLIPGDVALKHNVLPLKREGRTLTVGMADPTNVSVLDDLKFITRYDIFPVIAGEYTLRTAFMRSFSAFGSNPNFCRSSVRFDLSRIRSTIFSPKMTGSVETRKSMTRLPILSLIRPSCGTRRSAMLRFDRILTRLVSAALSLIGGFITSRSEPSIR